MASYNPGIADRLRGLMAKHRLNPNSLARYCQLAVSKATIHNWLEGQQPAEENLLRVLRYFPDEDPSDWLKLYDLVAA